MQPTSDEIDEAKQNPNGWVYRIDAGYNSDDPVPPRAILGAWKVDGAGKIVGDFMPNPKYGEIASGDAEGSRAEVASPTSATPRTGAASDSVGPSILRMAINGLSVVGAILTMAPVGLLYLLETPKQTADRWMAAFWFVYLPIALLGSFLPGRRDGGLSAGLVITLAVMIVAVLNIGGCVSALTDFGRATGGG